MSPTVGKLADALSKAQDEMEGASKDSTNPHFKSKYADLAAVREACRPLSKHGIAHLQPTSADGSRVTVTTMLMHSSGEWIAQELTLTAGQANPQAVGSAITYGRRYGLSAMVGIAPEDDDGEAAHGREHAQAQRQQPPPVKPEVVVKPDGYDAFLKTYLAAASKGLKALREVYKNTTQANRDYLMKQDAVNYNKAVADAETATKNEAAAVPV